MGPIYSTEPVTAKRFLSSWAQRDAAEKWEAGKRFKSLESRPITAGLARDYPLKKAKATRGSGSRFNLIFLFPEGISIINRKELKAVRVFSIRIS